MTTDGSSEGELSARRSALIRICLALVPPLAFSPCSIETSLNNVAVLLYKSNYVFPFLLAAILLTYEGAPLGVEFAGHADAGAQVQHDEHGGDHHYALHQQQRLEVSAKSVRGESRRKLNLNLIWPERTTTLIPRMRQGICF